MAYGSPTADEGTKTPRPCLLYTVPNEQTAPWAIDVKKRSRINKKNVKNVKNVDKIKKRLKTLNKKC